MSLFRVGCDSDHCELTVILNDWIKIKTAALRNFFLGAAVLLLCNLKLLDDFAVAFTECACSIGFVSVDVHCSSKLGAYTNNNITENEASAVGVDLYGYDFLVSYACSFCVCGSEVDVTLCSDNAFSDFNFACRANELARTGASNVAGFTNRSGYAESTSVGEGDFNLGCGTRGTEDDYVGNGLLGTNYGYSFFASELTGLGEVLLVGKGCAFTEKDLDVFFRKMHVTCAGFN